MDLGPALTQHDLILINLQRSFFQIRRLSGWTWIWGKGHFRSSQLTVVSKVVTLKEPSSFFYFLTTEKKKEEEAKKQ